MHKNEKIKRISFIVNEKKLFLSPLIGLKKLLIFNLLFLFPYFKIFWMNIDTPP